jgi:hypothetical protein
LVTLFCECCSIEILRYDEMNENLSSHLRILTIMNPHSYHREHLLYSRIGLGVFLR